MASIRMETNEPDSISPRTLSPVQDDHRSIRFLDFPREIRDQIYTELLSSDINRTESEDGYTKYKFYTTVLQANRQINVEASDVFQRRNRFIRIETPWRQAEQHVAEDGRVPLLAIGDEADGSSICNELVLRAVIDVPEMPYGTASKFVILLRDLPAFCRMWFYSDLSHTGLNGHLRLTLNLAEPGSRHASADGTLPLALQRQLLSPFGMVKDLHSMKIHGARDPTIESTLRAEMSKPYDSPEHCLDETTRLKDAGNAQLKKGNHRAAIALYAQAFHAMHIVVCGRRRYIWADAFFERELRAGAYAGQYGGIVRMILRVRLVANIILAYLRLGEHADAYFWGMRSINLMRDALGEAADEPRQAFPAPNEWGKVYYRTAQACKALDKLDEARDLLRIAAAWMPNDAKVKAEHQASIAATTGLGPPR